jgi:UDP-glucose 4-epimerase
MCQSFSRLNHIPTISLLPPGVWNEQTYFDILEARRRRPEYEWDPYWEYGAFVDGRDMADLIVKILTTDYRGYGCYLVASDDITTSGSTGRELVSRIHPQVKWRNCRELRGTPYGSLLDCQRVKEAFQWEPRFTWKRFMDEGGPNEPVGF